MMSIQFPSPQFRTRMEGEKRFIFDPIRKRWLLLTEEEWVRQNFVQFLIQSAGYPSSQIALEKEILLYELKKRFDILVYDRNHRPWMMIECKASHIPLNEEVLQQVLRYNLSIPVPYLIISNGMSTVGWLKSEGQLHLLKELPPWKD